MPNNTSELYTEIKTIDEDYARSAVLDLYAYCRNRYKTMRVHDEKLVEPDANPLIIFVDGPRELLREMGEFESITRNPFSPEGYDDIAHFVTHRGMSSSMRMRSVLISVFKDHNVSIPDDTHYKGKYEYDKVITKVWDQCYAIATYKSVCYVINRPLDVTYGEDGFHCGYGAAIKFRDGSEVFCYRGRHFDRKFIMEPEKVTLREIQKLKYRKHVGIAAIGVERYLDLLNDWKMPETKGRLEKFFSLSKMVLPGDDLPDEKDERGLTKYRERGYGHSSYKDKPYEVVIGWGDVNGTSGLKMESAYEVYGFSSNKKPWVKKYASKLFEEKDYELWDLLGVNEMIERSCHNLKISFMGGKFRLTSDKTCRHDVAPAWFRAKMLLGEDAIYETESYAVKYEKGELTYETIPGYGRAPLFRGNENLPNYTFAIDLESDSWAGLLEKWAELSFEWLWKHGDSTVLC